MWENNLTNMIADRKEAQMTGIDEADAVKQTQ